MKNIDIYGNITGIDCEETPNGTCLQGEIEVSYKKLVKVFGKASDGDGYKTDAEWIIMTPVGIATIYNYKDGKNYCGIEGTPKTKITDWHIGGHTKTAVSFIILAIKMNI